jgi:hypothetical protein
MLHLHTDANGYLKMLRKYCITCNSYYVRGMGKDCRRDLRELLHNYTSPDLRKNSRISRKASQFTGRKSESHHVNCFHLAVMFKFVATKPLLRRSRWPRGLRRGSAATPLLGLQDRIQEGIWLSVSSECCMLSQRGVALSSRVVLPSVMCLSEISKHQQ